MGWKEGAHLHPPLPLVRLLPIEQVGALVVRPQRLPQIHRRQHQEDEAQHVPAVVLRASPPHLSCHVGAVQGPLMLSSLSEEPHRATAESHSCPVQNALAMG